MAAIPLSHNPEIEYPESDGKPMAETDVHRDVMVHLIETLRDRFGADPDVYVSGNLLLYYEEGRPASVLSPDVFVVRGVPAGRRNKYLLWEEGKAPCLVVEITSRSTRNEDLQKKKGLYARLGVEEYFLFDPLGEYLKPRFQGFRLLGGEYQPILPGPDGTLAARTIGVLFHPDGSNLRLSDLATGQPLFGFEDWRNKAREQEAARRVAEARVQTLAEELERLRRERLD